MDDYKDSHREWMALYAYVFLMFVLYCSNTLDVGLAICGRFNYGHGKRSKHINACTQVQTAQLGFPQASQVFSLACNACSMPTGL